MPRSRSSSSLSAPRQLVVNAGDALAHAPHLPDQVARILAGALLLAHLAGDGVAARLQLVALADQRAATLVERQDAVDPLTRASPRTASRARTASGSCRSPFRSSIRRQLAGTSRRSLQRALVTTRSVTVCAATSRSRTSIFENCGEPQAGVVRERTT
jgi:hypothetical protein